MARIPIAFAALATAGFATSASAAGSAGFRLQASVPEVCEIHVALPIMAEEDAVVTAQVFEMCNSQRGFQVIASHRALDAEESVRIDYGGQVNELDSSGVSSLAVRHGPALRSVPVLVRSASLASALVISVGMVAI